MAPDGKLKINFYVEQQRDPGLYSCSAPMVWSTAYGNTPEEVLETMRKMAGNRRTECVGLMNDKADWEAVFGPVDDPKYTFMDTKFDEPKRNESWLKKLFTRNR